MKKLRVASLIIGAIFFSACNGNSSSESTNPDSASAMTSSSFNHPAAAGNYIDLFSKEKRRLERKQFYSFKSGEFKVYFNEV